MQLGVLNREQQLEKTLASELAQKSETICCCIMYLPGFWSGISTIFLTDCCSLSFYSGRRDCEGCNSLQSYRLQVANVLFFLTEEYTYTKTHMLFEPSYADVCYLWDIEVIIAQAFIMSLMLTIGFSSSKEGGWLAEEFLYKIVTRRQSPTKLSI